MLSKRIKLAKVAKNIVGLSYDPYYPTSTILMATGGIFSFINSPFHDARNI